MDTYFICLANSLKRGGRCIAGEIRIGEAQFIPLLSVVRLKSIVPIPSQSHTEDVHYAMMQVVGKVKASNDVLR